MKIEILGSGCAKCKKMAENIDEAVKQLNINCEIEKVTDMQKIMEYGVMILPGLVIDGTVKSIGKVLSIEEAKKILM